MTELSQGFMHKQTCPELGLRRISLSTKIKLSPVTSILSVVCLLQPTQAPGTWMRTLSLHSFLLFFIFLRPNPRSIMSFNVFLPPQSLTLFLPSTRVQILEIATFSRTCLTCSPCLCLKIQPHPIRRQSVTHSDRNRFSTTRLQGLQVSPSHRLVPCLIDLFLCDASKIRDWVVFQLLMSERRLPGKRG